MIYMGNYIDNIMHRYCRKNGNRHNGYVLVAICNHVYVTNMDSCRIKTVV